MSSSPKIPGKGPKEMSSELRMLLAFGLMGIILFGSNWAYHKFGLIPDTPPTVEKKESTVSKATPLPNTAPGSLPGNSGSTTPEAASPGDAATVAPVAAVNKQTWSVDTDVYHVV